MTFLAAAASAQEIPAPRPVTPGAPFFTASPLDPAVILVILPLGSMTPGGHVFPTDHIYLNWRAAPDSPTLSLPPVVAPAAGVVTAIQRAPGAPDARITVQVSRTFFYYLAHVEPDATLAVGATLAAGQRIGTGTSRTVGIDLGVVNMEVSNFFAAPRRYPLESRADSAGEHLAPQKLQRLLYLAQAHFAGAHEGAKLMPATFLATELGPLEPNVFYLFQQGTPKVVYADPPTAVEEFLMGLWTATAPGRRRTS